jgi:hypothetical protein
VLQQAEIPDERTSKYRCVEKNTLLRMDCEESLERAHQSMIAERRAKDHYRLLLVRLGDLDDQPPSDRVKEARQKLWKEALEIMLKYET